MYNLEIAKKFEENRLAQEIENLNGTVKVVINTCYGGFGLSPLALKTLVLAGSDAMEENTESEYYGEKGRKNEKYETWVDIGDGFETGKFLDSVLYKEGKIYFLKHRWNCEIRIHPDVIKVIQDLGEASWGKHSKLKIVEVPKDVDWEIDEYDGAESIREKSRSWG